MDKKAHLKIEGIIISKFIVLIATNLIIMLRIVGIMMLTKLKRRLIMQRRKKKMVIKSYCMLAKKMTFVSKIYGSWTSVQVITCVAVRTYSRSWMNR